MEMDIPNKLILYGLNVSWSGMKFSDLIKFDILIPTRVK